MLSIKSIEANDILSFGKGMSVELGALNVLIGPNGSGKSNLLDIIRLISATPDSVTKPMGDSGGYSAWETKLDRPAFPQIQLTAKWEADLYEDEERVFPNLRHSIEVFSFGLISESLEGHGSDQKRTKLISSEWKDSSAAHYDGTAWAMTTLDRADRDASQSVLKLLRDRVRYPYISALVDLYQGIRFYSDWDTSRRGSMRLPIPADTDGSFLEPSGSNLALVLNSLLNQPPVKLKILAALRSFCPRITDITSDILQGAVLTHFHEDGPSGPISIPISRISDGTLRFLCLLCVLCHPKPPYVICIEEPELGLHPDMMSTLADLMINASTKCQLVVTTLMPTSF